MNVMQKFGIRGRMFFAFGVIASVTIITSIIAWIAYDRLGSSVRQIARNDIAAVSLAAELAEKGGAITATAPALERIPEKCVRFSARKARKKTNG